MAVGGGEEPGRVSAWHPWILTAGRLAMDWQHFPSCHWKTSSLSLKRKNPFHNTEPTINTDLCRILFHCFQNSCSRGVRAKHIWAYLHVTHIRQNITHAAEAYLNVSWLFYARIAVKPAHWLRAPCTKCLAPSHGKLSAHLILMHFISPPFPPLSL